MANYQPAPREPLIKYPQALLILLIAGCSKPLPTTVPDSIDDELIGERLIVWQLENSQAASKSAERLVGMTRSFLNNPVLTERQNWQDAWLIAHDHWLATAFFSSRDAPVYRNIDAWPIAPGFLDSLPGYPGTGIVNDATLEMTSGVLRDQHHYTDEVEVALGFHVIEYYAFSRSVADFEPGAAEAERRTHLLRLIADLLLLDVLTYIGDSPTGLDGSAANNLPGNKIQLLQRMQRKSQEIFSEYNRLGEHDQFSGESLRSITVQLELMRELLREPMAMNHYLIALDPKKTQTLNDTLDEAIELISGRKALDEASASHGVLLVSSISHQLDDLVRLLPKSH